MVLVGIVRQLQRPNNLQVRIEAGFGIRENHGDAFELPRLFWNEGICSSFRTPAPAFFFGPDLLNFLIFIVHSKLTPTGYILHRWFRYRVRLQYGYRIIRGRLAASQGLS